jgi:hypothetical protein
MLKSGTQRNQRCFRPFFIAAGKIVEFESPEPILDAGQRNRMFLKYTHKFLMDEFAPVSFEKEGFHNNSLFDSIHPN